MCVPTLCASRPSALGKPAIVRQQLAQPFRAQRKRASVVATLKVVAAYGRLHAFGRAPFAELSRQYRPNPSLKRTAYGSRLALR